MSKQRTELLGESLGRASEAARNHVLRSEDLSRVDRERLQKAGYLRPIIKGWYSLTTPESAAGESTAWYSTFWHFLEYYLNHRFGHDYCLGAEASLVMHLASTNIPRQITVMTTRGGQSVLDLPFETSIVMYTDTERIPAEEDITRGARVNVRMMSLPMALVRIPVSFFERHTRDADIALRMLEDISDLTRVLVKGGHGSAAGRLIGAMQHLGMEDQAREVKRDMEAAGYECPVENPFEADYASVLHDIESPSPYPARLRAMWEHMREVILEAAPAAPGLPADADAYLADVDRKYERDAYNSLSIEGYHVTPELVHRMREGVWNPDQIEEDREASDALAARGYSRAHELVKESLRSILAGEEAGLTAVEYLHLWHRGLFSGYVEAGTLKEHHLIGYRQYSVFIKGSLHVPPPSHALRDSMSEFMSRLQHEPHPFVRAVLGHFIFTFIHPYMDGNGRVARFLMNTMLASGGYPWIVVPKARRDEYLATLEEASVAENIIPFRDFILSLLEEEHRRSADPE